MTIKPYKHTVQYYETDRMGFVHHSNYIRWMEEARSDFFDQIGWPYVKTEEMGIISPVVALDCKYKQPLPFDFYLPQKNICIEFQGEQHYKERSLYYSEESQKLSQYIKYENNIVYVKLIGACAGCSMIDITLKDGIEELIINEVPEVKEVRNIDD